MKVRLEIVAEVPDGTTRNDLSQVFHSAMRLYSKSAAIHMDLDKNVIAKCLEELRETLTMTELTILDDLADV